MGAKTAITALWLLLLALSDGVEVKMKGEWVPEMGWEIKCVYHLSRQLQSVRLYLDNLQFAIYRPEVRGRMFHSNYTTPPGGVILDVTCEYDMHYAGLCTIRVEPLRPPMFPARFTCEASEEAPRFDIQKAEYVLEAYVPQTQPKLHVNKINGTTLANCTSAGIPAPRIRWQIGDHRIQETFSSQVWDFKTKLWHSWSVVSILEPSELPLICLSTTSKNGTTFDELVAEVDISSASLLRGELHLLGLATLVALLR